MIGTELTINDTADSTARSATLNGGTSTITGIGGPITYGTLENVTVNAGSGGDTLNVQGTQAAVTSLFAGGGDDTVAFGNGATLSGGLLDGGSGTNTLDYSAYTTAVAVDLSAAQAQTLFLATLSGAQEPGPLSSSPATGSLVGTLNAAQTAFTFNIAYQGLTGSPISGTHFHNQSAGVNGPIVRGLFPSEQNGLTTPSGTFFGVWSTSDPTLDPPASDAPVRPLNAPSPVTPGSTLVQELLAGRIYFNIHTLPNFPSGEIRGQLISMGTVNPATGTGGVRGFDNVTGGSGGDALTGNANVNVLRGGPGGDTITGGQGGDQLFGDAGNDLLVWNNGDGSDFMEGGGNSDTVQVNGSPAGGDQFLLQVNPADPTRLRFDRTNLGLFNLNIGTTEALDFNTLGGDDTTTLEFAGGNPIPAGIAGGPGIDFDGGAGGDQLVLQRSAGTFVAPAETYIATGPDSGDITVGGGLIRFSSLTPVTDTVPATNFTFTAPASSPALNVVSGPAVGGFNTTQINDLGTGSFELITFANKTNVTANSGTTSQLINVNSPAATGLASLTVNGNAGSDTFNVKASATATINVNGGLPLVSPGDSLNYDTEGRTVSGDTTPPDGSISSPGVQPVNFTGIEAVNLPNVPLSINDVAVTEGNSGSVNAVFTVTLPSADSQTVTVDYVTGNGTATAPADYTSVSGTLTFAPGQTSRTITVPVNGDTLGEADETFFVTLSNPQNATLSDSQGTGTILNDDGIQFSQGLYTVNEHDGFVTITVRRQGDTSQPASVEYMTDDGSTPSVATPCSSVTGIALERCDYTYAAGTLNFAAGESEKTFVVLVSKDSYVEGTEVTHLRLSNPGGGTLGSLPSAEMQITDDPLQTTNPIDNPQDFVQQHYHDFLNREPDPPGFTFWTNQMTNCGSPNPEVCRVNVSAAFFLSIEFQQTGFLVERMYKAAYGDATGVSNLGGAHQLAVPVVRLHEFLPDTQRIGRGVIVGQGAWEQQLESNKAAFALEFVSRLRFTNAYPASMTAEEFVTTLDARAGGVLTPAEIAQLEAVFGGPAASSNDAAKRARVLRSVAENATLQQREFNRAFVLMQYFGYLGRNPDDAPDADYTGYDFWLAKLNQFNGDYVKAEMVKAFLQSDEYRHRFGL